MKFVLSECQKYTDPTVHSFHELPRTNQIIYHYNTGLVYVFISTKKPKQRQHFMNVFISKDRRHQIVLLCFTSLLWWKFAKTHDLNYWLTHFILTAIPNKSLCHVQCSFYIHYNNLTWSYWHPRRPVGGTHHWHSRGPVGGTHPHPSCWDLGWGVFWFDPPHSDVLLKPMDPSVYIPVHLCKISKELLAKKKWFTAGLQNKAIFAINNII
jgi:hypothetical protein